ncbi:uncharacterized protein Z519_04999 [Cladophialophora bantiana CBS 173.52]|uniref:Uncharacterized protein n=1 Tax=Cladophialophora bantiana (strain ATCC 10958 / CBS 173.52 / CDC B-1940 / NIH 8579) TaxID=1442370 RepID=A0A0D2IE38_CLAB1|nr:uncharacterized protein Z519_04999 [Cladophialophora bantiana CBS 173.52]KIW95019.1 hypothetical protein Z519_04999 [Cladophialophora bantiana CBS 173.52]
MHLRRHEFSPDDGQRYIGLQQSKEMLDFLHNSYFAAVAGDQPGFEAIPSDAACCATNNKWTFLIASAPKNAKGGVGSMANAIAIL